MAPRKFSQNRRGVLRGVHKGRPPKKKHGRPIGAKNANEERPYSIEDLRRALEMDINRRKYPDDDHPYPSRRSMCEAMLIPESTIISNLERMRKSGQIEAIVVQPLGLTGKRL